MDAESTASSSLYTPRKAPAPFTLTLSCEGQLTTADDLHAFWSALHRARDLVDDGHRLENLSWRLWQRARLGESGLVPPLPALAPPALRASPGAHHSSASDASVSSCGSSLRPPSSIATTVSSGGPPSSPLEQAFKAVLEAGAVDPLPSPTPARPRSASPLRPRPLSPPTTGAEPHVRFIASPPPTSPSRRSPLGMGSRTAEPEEVPAMPAASAAVEANGEEEVPSSSPTDTAPSVDSSTAGPSRRPKAIKVASHRHAHAGLRRNTSERAFRAGLPRAPSAREVRMMQAVREQQVRASSSSSALAAPVRPSLSMTRSRSTESNSSRGSRQDSTSSLQSIAERPPAPIQMPTPSSSRSNRPALEQLSTSQSEPRSISRGFFTAADANRAAAMAPSTPVRNGASPRALASPRFAPEPVVEAPVLHEPPREPVAPARSALKQSHAASSSSAAAGSPSAPVPCPPTTGKKNNMFFVGSVQSEDETSPVVGPSSSVTSHTSPLLLARRSARLSDAAADMPPPVLEELSSPLPVRVIQATPRHTPEPSSQRADEVEDADEGGDANDSDAESWASEESSDEEDEEEAAERRRQAEMFAKRAVPGPNGPTPAPIKRVQSSLTALFHPELIIDDGPGEPSGLSAAMRSSLVHLPTARSAVSLPVTRGGPVLAPLPPRPSGRPSGPPPGAELESDDEDEEGAAPDPHFAEHQARKFAELLMRQQEREAMIAPPQTPRTTRRNMLATEMSESMRYNLLWERQTRRRAMPEIRRSTIEAEARAEREANANGSGLQRSKSAAAIVQPDHDVRSYTTRGFHQSPRRSYSVGSAVQRQDEADQVDRHFRRALAFAGLRSFGTNATTSEDEVALVQPSTPVSLALRRALAIVDG